MDNDTLYNISDDLLTVIEKGVVFDQETGEVYFDESDTEALAMRLADKLEGVQAVSSAKRARAAYLESEAKRISAMAKALKKSADSLDAYAVKCVQPLGRVETDHYVIGTRTTEAVQVVDETAVPTRFMREKTSWSVDKAAVKKAIKEGESVPGCALVKNVNLTVK